MIEKVIKGKADWLAFGEFMNDRDVVCEAKGFCPVTIHLVIEETYIDYPRGYRLGFPLLSHSPMVLEFRE